MPVRSISYWITTEPTKRRASSGGSLAIRDISCTSPRPAAHGSIKWSGGLQASRRSAFVADRSRACPVLKKRFRIISTTITSTRNLSSGPQTPNSSSARFNDFVNEFLTQDTSESPGMSGAVSEVGSTPDGECKLFQSLTVDTPGVSGILAGPSVVRISAQDVPKGTTISG